MNTPWGVADRITPVGTIDTETISWVSTPSHGGYFVPDRLLSFIPTEHQKRAAYWSGSRNWYEEDYEWASVALAFPRFFTTSQVEEAKQMMRSREALAIPWKTLA